MLKKKGNRILKEHGLISCILPALSLENQIAMSNVCLRTYQITVPWFSVSIPIMRPTESIFPKIDEITQEFVCKRIQTTIEGESGYFYGSVSKQTGQPAGAGVFVTDDGWIHCGDFRDDTFADGNQVSVNP